MPGFDSQPAHFIKMEENKTLDFKEKNWYDKSYKILLIIPLLLFIGSFVYLYFFYAANGDIVYKDVSITGGTTMTVFAKINVDLLEENLREKFPDVIVNSITDFRSREQTGFLVETISPAEELKIFLEDYLGYELNSENSSIEFTGTALSSSFYQQLRFAMIISFVLMAIVVFFIFRTPIRSLSIILAGFADIMMTIVVVDLLGIRLSISGIVALLMLIGYSVDVDIM